MAENKSNLDDQNLGCWIVWSQVDGFRISDYVDIRAKYPGNCLFINLPGVNTTASNRSLLLFKDYYPTKMDAYPEQEPK